MVCYSFRDPAADILHLEEFLVVGIETVVVTVEGLWPRVKG